jgi:hypothetical protein
MSRALVRSTRLARPVSKKERFQQVDREEVLRKIRSLSLTSWNYIGHDPEKFRHYGPMAQEFFAAFGNDGVGTVGSPHDNQFRRYSRYLMTAVQALEKRTAELKERDARIAALEHETAELRAKQTQLETIAARLDALELKSKLPVQVRASAPQDDTISEMRR